MSGQKTISSTWVQPTPPSTIIPLSGTFYYEPVTHILRIYLIFSDTMSNHNIASKHWIMRFDGNPYEPDGPESWVTDKKYSIQHTQIGFEPSTATLDYDGSDPLFKSVAGNIVAAFTDFPLTKI